MKKLLLLLFFNLIVAPLTLAEETETWSCQGTAAGGLYWENGEWQAGEFGTRIYRIELNAYTATISENNDPALVIMECKSRAWSWSCSNDATALELNKDNSSAVFIRFFGGIFPDDDVNQKDSIYIEVLQCEQFE